MLGNGTEKTKGNISGLDDEFPYKTRLSFGNLIRYWEDRIKEAQKHNDVTAFEVERQLKNAPELYEPIDDLSLIGKYHDIIALMMEAVMPPALSDSSLVSANIPFSSMSFFSTSCFDKLNHSALSIKDDQNRKRLIKSMKLLHAGFVILNKIYHFNIKVKLPIILHLPDEKTGLDNYYNLQINPAFCEVVPLKEPKKIGQDEINALINDVYNEEKWLEYFPADAFEFRGFGILSLIDVSDQEILSAVKFDLLKKDAITSHEKMEAIQRHLRSLFQIPDLRAGLIAFSADENSYSGTNIWNSILLNNEGQLECNEVAGSIYEKVLETNETVIIEDLSSRNAVSNLEKKILAKGIRNVLLAPLIGEKGSFGILELCSPNPYDLNPLSTLKLQDVLPLFSVASERSAEEKHNKISAIIKEKYTSIHPSVEWRFVKAASRIIESEDKGFNPELENIRFENVFPLFGQSDVRGSTEARSRAIQDDLIDHLQLAKQVIERAYSHKKLPILDEYSFRIKREIENVTKGLNSGDEISTLEFLKAEVEPLFNHLRTADPALQRPIQKYFNAIDSDHGFLNKRRRQFDESILLINKTAINVLDRAQTLAQKMYPHYFERYKTDGIEYNIYIGRSISSKGKFHELYLKNLRLWQLITTCEIARKIEAVRDRLPIPLETTHLILVYSAQLTIRFRMDEKKFDVEGAYNLRYEILKKRIDKAHIKNSEERLTQPGKILIIYSQQKEAQEYQRYIEYLKQRDFLTGEIEYLEVEDLQGIVGLKALRVAVNFHHPKEKNDPDIMALVHEGLGT